MSKFSYLAKRYIVPAATRGNGPRLICDIETDELLETATTVHCIAIADLDSQQTDCYGPAQIGDGLTHLAHAAFLVGHNVTNFDLPVLQRLCGWAPPGDCTVMDTLVASRLILPNLSDLDDKAAAMGDPKLGKLRGRYSLEAWGARLGVPKVGTDIADWSKWTPEMQERCIADVAICKALWHFLQPDGYSPMAMQLEHRVAPICARITADGVPFDVAAAERLHQQWVSRRSELEAQLREQFPGTKLSSRVQIAALLEARGWKPEKRTEKTGRPCIDDELLETIPALYPEFTGLSEHYVLGRRLGQLTNGKEAWRKHIAADGRIHGGLVHIGTPHSRAKHLNPNLAQVPNPKKGKPFATECRALFRASNGWVFVAADQSNLQDRGFAHYLAAFDGGAYACAFLNGADTHWQTTTALGLVANDASRDKQNKLHTSLREGAKRFRYAFLYGCGAEKAGIIINDAARAAQQIDPASTLQQKLFGTTVHPSTPALIKAGKRALNKFEDATPGLRELRACLKAHAHKHEWLPGLDKRRVPVRALHSALNFIITSSEAIICKRWMVRVYDELCERFKYGWGGDVVIVLWVHDELVACCRPEIAEQVGEVMVRHAVEPGEFYKFKVPLAAEFKISNSWAADEPTDTPATPAEIAPPAAATKITPTFRTSDLPTSSKSKHNLAAAAENDAGAELPPEPSTLEPAHICAQCRLDPPDGGERQSAYNDLWLHAHCENAFIRTRMSEEGLVESAAAAPLPSKEQPPPPPPKNPPPPPPPPPPKEPPPRGNGHGYPWGEREVGAQVAEYIYRDMKGAPYLKVVKRVTKKGRKTYPQYHLENGSWVKGKPAGPAIPYRLPELLAVPVGAAIWVPEGELCADALAALGLIATTNPGGAGKWTPELNKWLAGFELAYLCEDNDTIGRNHVSKVATALSSAIPDIRILTFRELPEHGDVADWLKAGGTLEQLLERARQAPKFAELESVRAIDEEMEALDWIWPGRFALGKIGLLAGLPDEGKGLWLSDIMARISRGLPWPCAEGQAPIGNVILFTAEDDIRDTIIPRLEAAGADLGRIEIVKMLHTADQGPRMFSLISDLGALRQKVADVGDVRMIVIDPITAYLGIGKIDSFRATDVRAVLGPLKEFAAELHVLVLGVMHFNKKIDITNVLLRISDSLAYGAAARHVYAVVDDPDNRRKLFVKGKNNLAPRDQKTLAFSFDAREVGTDKRTGMPILAPFIVWHTDAVDITATEALQAAAASKSPSACEAAKTFLDVLLNDGPVDAKDVIEAAEANGIALRTLKRARSELHIEVRKDGPIVNGERTWRWHPATKKEPPE